MNRGGRRCSRTSGHTWPGSITCSRVPRGWQPPANPLLRPAARAVEYTVERWADERAATAVGDRRLVAHAIGRAALAAKANRPRRVIPDALGAVFSGTRVRGARPRRPRAPARRRPARPASAAPAHPGRGRSCRRRLRRHMRPDCGQRPAGPAVPGRAPSLPLTRQHLARRGGVHLPAGPQAPASRARRSRRPQSHPPGPVPGQQATPAGPCMPPGSPPRSARTQSRLTSASTPAPAMARC